MGQIGHKVNLGALKMTWDDFADVLGALRSSNGVQTVTVTKRARNDTSH